jgi:hypothetical protein
MSSGGTLGSWSVHGDNEGLIGGDGNGAGLSWVNGDRSLAFRWPVPPTRTNPGRGTIRTIDVTAGGHDLLADSRVAMQLPSVAAPTKTTFSALCASSVTASDGTVVCGTSSFSDVSFQEVCSTVPPSIVTYSGTTGKQRKVLYRYHGQCLEAQAMPVWTDPAGRHVIAFLLLSEKDVKTSATDKFGLVADGHFTPLPKLVVGIGDAVNQGGLAF